MTTLEVSKLDDCPHERALARRHDVMMTLVVGPFALVALGILCHCAMAVFA